MHYRPNQMKIMPGKIVGELPPKMDWQRRRLKIADPRLQLHPHPPPQGWNSCPRLRPADQDRSLPERGTSIGDVAAQGGGEPEQSRWTRPL